MTKACGILAAVSGLALASGALGQVWAEQGDAGDLPATAQECTGAGSLTSITGTHVTDDADMYRIKIVDEANFSATTVGQATWDTQLWLFDASNSRGVSFNDDSQSTLQSTLTSRFVAANGEYFIAISRYNRDLLNAGAQLIWANSPFGDERAPDGPGAGDPVPASWSGTTTEGGAYTINLTGCEFLSSCYPDCDTSTGVGVLDIFDFLCFQNRYDAGAAYACDCDLSTGVGVCDIFDFICFQNAYAAGCP